MAEITAEQVAEAIDGARARARAEGPRNIFGAEWERVVPDYVRESWFKAPLADPQGYIAALTRWRDSLPVANSSTGADVRWAAQLESLLGDAP